MAPAPLTEEQLSVIRPHFGSIRTPSTHDKVYKDECVYSFDTPYSAGGLFVSLATWQGFGEAFFKLDHQKTGNALYLHEKWTKVPTKVEEGSQESKEATILAIGVEGGFKTEDQKYETVKEHELVILGPGEQETRIAYPHEDLPTLVVQSCDAIIAHAGAAEQSQVTEWVADTDVPVSKYALSLPQVDNGKRISSDPKTWVCEDSGMTDNLWLNLSDGYIGSGRRNWDGSGGTGAALAHYEATGRRFPLCVKLGTITAAGADVYSYAADEDGMVQDPQLATHLQHFGIDIMSLEKTDKTMAELEVQLNKRYDFNAITEAGKELVPLAGPGLTGMRNLGNSCYMNSVLQLLATTEEVAQRYLPLPSGGGGGGDSVGGVSAAEVELFRDAPPEAASDFVTQMTKLMSGLRSGRYSRKVVNDETKKGESEQEKEEREAEELKHVEVAPRMLKHLVGKGHAEFSTGRQQDAAEYVLHLLEVMGKAERKAAASVSTPTVPSLFAFEREQRIVDTQSGGVRYKGDGRESLLSLPIPLGEALNREEVQAYKERVSKRQKVGQAEEASSTTKPDEEEDEVRPVIPLSACLERLSAAAEMEDYLSPVTLQKGLALQTSRLRNFPKLLLLSLGRYFHEEGTWEAKKMEVDVEMPETLDLEFLRGRGLQEGETPLPEDPTPPPAPDAAPAAAALEPDQAIVTQLTSAGFGENGCRRAAVATANGGAEAAMEWVLAHMGDADFNDPLPAPGVAAAAVGSGGDEPSAESVGTLSGFGFSEKQSKAALRKSGGDVERAADMLFSDPSQFDVEDPASMDVEAAAAAAGGGGGGGDGGSAAEEPPLGDGVGQYSLVGFVSHVGRNTACGHYVVHIKKEGKWVIFDDQKVAESAAPPLKLGYLYLYRRND